jgi:hypothetical protein
MLVKAGDVFFTRGQSLLGRLIRWAQSDPGETNGVWANHAGVVVARGELYERNAELRAVVVEALGRVKRHAWVQGSNEVRVFRPVPPLSAYQLAQLLEAADAFVGDRYGWWKLLFHLVDRAAFKGQKVLSSLLRVDNRPICSYLAAKVFAAAGQTFGMLPQAADPDEMLDYCLAHPEEWEEVC